MCSRYQVAQAYMEDTNARITVFAPVNDAFLYNPDLRAMDQKETLGHIGYFFDIIYFRSHKSHDIKKPRKLKNHTY